MKKMTKQFFIAVMALAAFTACSDANLAEGESGINELNFDIPMYSSVLTDASGQAILRTAWPKKTASSLLSL